MSHLRPMLPRTARQRGNAILISLIIMASTLTISLGIAALVGNEIKTTGLLVPSERAYYKAESFVEQALWNKTKGDAAQGYGPNYQAPSKDVSDGGGRSAVKSQAYVCTTAPCFTVDPRSTDSLLKRFSATTQPPSDTITLPQDEPQQLEVGSVAQAVRPIIEVSDAKASAVPDGVVNQNPAANYAGLEVTIIATPKTTACNNYQGTALSRSVGPTCTFVDKQRIGKTEVAKTFNLGTSSTNAVGELAPTMDSYNYRLRVRALGADASAKIRVRLADGTNLTLRTPDFTALAVAEDTRAQRGVQVVVPDVPEVLNIFDYVLFADADLEKLNAKQPDDARGQSITTNVFDDLNCNGLKDPGEVNVSGIGIGLSGGPDGQVQSADTNTSGNVTFANLYTGNYLVSLGTLPPQYVVCNPVQQSVTVTSGQSVATALRIRTKRVPLYQYWSAALGNHYYTVNYFQAGATGDFLRDSYAYEGIAGYVYKNAVTGTVPVYEFYYGFQPGYYALQDSYYSTNPGVPGPGWQYIGIAGYMVAYNGPNPYAPGYNPYDGSCSVTPGGTSIPWYRYLNLDYASNSNGFDHYYSQGFLPAFGPYYYEGITACLWSTD